MHLAFLIVAIALFAIDFLTGLVPSAPPWARGFTPLGLAFFAASFWPGIT